MAFGKRISVEGDMIMKLNQKAILRRSIFIAIICVLLGVLVGCGGGGSSRSLSGTWVLQMSNDDRGHITFQSIAFHGDSFTILRDMTIRLNPSQEAGLYLSQSTFVGGRRYHEYVWRSTERGYRTGWWGETIYYSLRGDHLCGQDGRRNCQLTRHDDRIEREGYYTCVFQFVIGTGTFSLSDGGEIVFNLSTGERFAGHFARDENTITFLGDTYTRQ